ncbi:MAG: uridylate kinase [Planctomycetota bacterium]|nr:MAG: uridylate kinase [Planctomycetota bacterium]
MGDSGGAGRGPFRRVLLKISGDAFCRQEGTGLEMAEVRAIARQIKAARASGAEMAVVVGGGNILRGAQLSQAGVQRATADYMGMLATVVNALALQDALEKIDVATRCLTAIEMQRVAEPYIRRRCIRHLEKGRVCILAGGTGNPFLTTDTSAALRAAEIGAEVLLKATKVDGVYDKDPREHPDARRFESLTYLDVLNRQLKVMDMTAISLCMETGLPILVFNLKVEGNIEKAVRGDRIGTLIGAG